MSVRVVAALGGLMAVLAALGVVYVLAARSDSGRRPAAPARVPAVVTVVVSQRLAGPPDRATGFVTAAGDVVTVAHVLDAGGRVSVRGPDGARPARLLRIDRAADLALLRVRRVADLGASGLRASGTSLVRVRDGHPESVPVDVRSHITARVPDPLGPRVYSRPSLELGAEVIGADSGAPVVDGRGRLLGVVFARREGGTAYAVEAAAVRALMRP